MNTSILHFLKYLLAVSIFFVLTSSQVAALEYTIQKYSSGQYLGLALADMDGDGKAELLAGNWLGNHVEIWKFDQSANSLILIDDIPGFPGNTISVAAADFDKDGDNDVVVGLRGAGLWYATNNGPGNWVLSPIDSTYSWKVLVKDFDQDGNLDIYDGANNPPFIRLFYGNGSGSFTNSGRSFPATVLPRGFNVADIDNDGLFDLIGTGAFYMRTFLNPGGQSTDWPSIGPVTPFATQGNDELVTNLSPSAADLDGNGVIDQVAYLHDFAANTREVIVFDGSVSASVYSWTKRVIDTFSATAAFGSAGLGDLNDDGNLDIHIGGGGANALLGLKVYLGDGAGNFTLEPIIDQNLGLPLDHGGGDQESIVTLDINGDGATDIVMDRVVNGVADGFELLLRIPPPVSVAIDIEPGNSSNNINLKSKGVIPVAILTTGEFDAITVDPTSLRFGPGEAMERHATGHPRDIDGDGDVDVMYHFRTQESGIQCGDASAGLTGTTFDGVQIVGSDSVITIKCP